MSSKGMYFATANRGYIFVLTEKGYNATPHLKKERKIGEPLKGFEKRVSNTWLNNGWVEEIPMNDKQLTDTFCVGQCPIGLYNCNKTVKDCEIIEKWKRGE